MRELLSKSLSRRVALLEELESEYSWVSSKELAKKLNCSLKTVVSDIQYLRETWSNYFIIQTSNQNGVRLIIYPEAQIKQIYEQLIRDSEAFSLLEELFFEPQQTAEFWMKNQYLSQSTLYRLSNEIHKALVNRGLRLSRHPYYVYSESDERQVRYFYTSYFIEVYGAHQWPFPIDFVKIRQFIKQIVSFHSIRFDEAQIVELSYLLIISAMRRAQGFHVEEKWHAELDPKVKNFLKANEKVIKKFIEPFNWELSSDWIHDICSTLFFYVYLWKTSEEKERLVIQIHDFIYTLQSAIGISITKQDIIGITDNMLYWYAQYRVYPYQRFILYDPEILSGGTIRNQYSTYTKIVEKALQQLEAVSHFPWYTELKNEVLYLLMIKWQDLPILIDHSRKTVSVLVLSDLGQQHTEMIAKSIKNDLQYKVDVKVNPDLISVVEGLEQADLSSYNLIVSNFYTEHIANKKLLVIEDIPTDRDWASLRHLIAKLRVRPVEEISFLNDSK